MRLALKIAVACFSASGLLSAAPPACITGTLASYIVLGAEGCTFYGNVFANFTYSSSASGGAATIKADQIIVSPSFLAPETTRFSFSAPWSPSARQSQDSVISYTAVLPCGDTRTAQLDLTLGTTQIKGIFGSVTVDESTNVGRLSVFTRCTEVCEEQANESLTFNPVSVLLVSNHVSLTGGNSGASLKEFAGLLNLCYPCP
jgi:hypothetical protein